MSWLIRNWHLKLGAVALATVLYTGLVYSGSFSEQTFPGVPVEGINQPSNAYPLTQQLGTVDIRYRLAADADTRVTVDSFAVTVDLSDYDMELAPEPQALPVSVRSLADGVDILGYTPTSVTVEIDRIGQREVPIVVDRGTVPEGLEIGPPQLSDETALATGPESQLGRVDRAVATVQIFESAIDVERQVDLVPVDVDGAEVESVELDPSTVTVQIEVNEVETSKTVPVRPQLNGSPAEGFEITAVSPDPAVVTILGMPDALGPIEEVRTQGIAIGGISESATFDTELALPDGARLAGGTGPVMVAVDVRAAVASRTFVVGLVCEGAPQGVACLPQQEQASVVLEGPAAVLADLSPGDVTPVLDVSGLDPGEHQVEPTVALPDGVELISISPGSVPVILRVPATPSPAPG